MATDVSRAKSAPTAKYDAFVAAQLARAESRIRLLDLTAALLGYAALALACVVGLVVLDGKLELSPHARQLALYGFLAGSAVYLLLTVVRPLTRRINPYYAARQVEQLLPGAKNSLVNWVDLHEEPLPPAIRGALGQRAAKDLSQVDLEQAIRGRRAGWTGAAAGLCAAAFIAAFFLLGPRPFFSLLKRAFNPFGGGAVSTRTQLTLRRPEGGNATVTVGRGVAFAVEVGGKVPDPKAPDAVRLLYRYEESEPYLERLLQSEGREWTTSLSGMEVKNGFWYRITGGDATTEEHRVSVRAAAALTYFLAAYHFRPYVARVDEFRHERNLKALRGTEVLLSMRTNRTVRDGSLEFEGKDGSRTVWGETVPGDPQLLQVRFVLDEDGHYRLRFTSAESEAYVDPGSFQVTVIPDNPPAVELTRPGQDIRLPADGLLHLEGKASDDIGVQSLVLRMQVVGGDKLQGQPYRSDDKLRLADGGYPLQLEYKDFVDLASVKSENGQPFRLQNRMEVEYWLEASDACDYPAPHVRQSKHYRVLITEPEKNEPKKQQETKQARQDQKQHEDKQDQQLQKENQARQQERRDQEAKNKEEQQKSEQAKGEAAGRKDEGTKDQPGSENQQSDKGEGRDPHNDGKGEQQNAGGKDDQLKPEEQKTEDKIKQQLEQAENKDKGESKPDQGGQGEAKGQQDKSDGGQAGDQAGQQGEGEGKDAGQQGAGQAGEGKDQGKAGAEPQQGDGKGEGRQDPMQGAKGEEKGGSPMNQPGMEQPGEGKGKPDQKPQPGEGKGSASPQESKDAGQAKAEPAQGQDSSAKAEGKEAGADGQRARGEGLGEAKENQGSRAKSEEKGTGKGDGSKSSAEAKAGDPGATGDKSGTGEAKGGPRGEAAREEGKGEMKPDEGARARKAGSREVAELAKDLQGDDAGKRDAAKRKLEQIKKQARDPLARERAEEELNQAEARPENAGESKAGSGQASGQSDEKKDANGEAKDGKGDGTAEAGMGKSAGSGGQGQADGDAKGKGQEGSQGSQGPTGKPVGDESPDGIAKGPRKGSAGATPGAGGNERAPGDGAGHVGGPGPDPGQPAKPRDHRAATLQLEDFLKKVDKNILKDAGVSEEEWKKYVAAKRKQVQGSEPPRPEAQAAPQQANTLPSIGGRQVKPGAGQVDDVRGADLGQPPPGYRDPVREFRRQIAKPK